MAGSVDIATTLLPNYLAFGRVTCESRRRLILCLLSFHRRGSRASSVFVVALLVNAGVGLALFLSQLATRMTYYSRSKPVSIID